MKSQRKNPVFTHPEVEALYSHDFAIPREKVEAILQLPRESLIEDLRKILKDSIDHFDFFQEKGWDENESEFVMHALWLLADLKAENTLSDVLELLRQDQIFLNFWFGDSLTENLWEVVFHLGINSLEQLKAFVLEPDHYTYANTAISTTLEQIALHHPNRRTEVVEWFRSVFEHFIALDNDDPLLIDGDFISSMAGDIISFEGRELLPLIKELDDKEWIFHGICGSYESIEADMGKYSMSFYKHSVYSSIFDRYKEALSHWHYYRMKYDEAYRKSQEPSKRKPASDFYAPSNSGQLYNAKKTSTFQRNQPKIGRNAPCPCGSGKKYKRCCGKKG